MRVPGHPAPPTPSSASVAAVDRTATARATPVALGPAGPVAGQSAHARVTFSQAARALSDEVTTERCAKVERLRDAVATGRLEVDARAIAHRLIEGG